MANKTQKSYRDVWAFMKENFSSLANLKKAVSDFELALRNSLREIYPNIKIQGCWFHYTQVNSILIFILAYTRIP